jgi:hypothetical protein
LYQDVTALHVTLVSWRYCIARDTCIMTLLHCTWHLHHDVTALHLYQDVTALHVTLVSWRYSIARDTCASEIARPFGYLTTSHSFPLCVHLQLLGLDQYVLIIIYIYIYIYVILRYLYFITGTCWAYSWLSFALPGKRTGHKIGPQFFIPIVPYRSSHSWPWILGYWSRKTSRAMYVKRNSEECSHNHCCRGEAIITYS